MPPINDSIIPLDLCKKIIINYTTYDIISKFEFVSKNKKNALYITETMQKYCLQMLYEYW